MPPEWRMYEADAGPQARLCPRSALASVRPIRERGAAYSDLRMLSTIFLASPNSIMVLSRKKSSFSTPA